MPALRILRSIRLLLSALLCAMLLAACGQKGPLTLPQPAPEVAEQPPQKITEPVEQTLQQPIKQQR